MEFYNTPCATSSMINELANDLNKNDFESLYVPGSILHKKVTNRNVISFVINKKYSKQDVFKEI